MRSRSWMLVALGLAASACVASARRSSPPPLPTPPRPLPAEAEPAVARIVPQTVTDRVGQRVVKDGAGRRWILASGQDVVLVREAERGRGILRAVVDANLADVALAPDGERLYMLTYDSAWPPPIDRAPDPSWSVEVWSLRQGRRVARASLGTIPGFSRAWTGLFLEPGHIGVQHCPEEQKPCVQVRLRATDVSEVDRKEIPFAERREWARGSFVRPRHADGKAGDLVHEHPEVGPGFPWIHIDTRSKGPLGVHDDGHGAVGWLERGPDQGFDVILLPGGRPDLPARVGSSARSFGFRRVEDESELVFRVPKSRTLERRRVRDREPLEPLPWTLGFSEEESDIMEKTGGADVVVATYTGSLMRYDRVSWSPALKVERLPMQTGVGGRDPLSVWYGQAGPQRWGLADVKEGISIADLTGRRPAVRIRPQGRVVGALAGADGSIYAAETSAPRSDEVMKRWLRVYQPDGKQRAEYALPRFTDSRSIVMGWSAPGGRQLWISGSDELYPCMGGGPCRIILATLPEQPSGALETRVRRIEGEGNLYALGAEGLFAMALVGEIGVRFFRGDGSTVLTTGMFEGEPFAYAPDGRWACRGRGCAALACVEGTEPRDADAPACKGSRVEGFDVLAEARAPVDQKRDGG